MTDDTDRLSLARWQGEIDARLRASEADRAGLHNELRELRGAGLAQHRELMAAITKLGEDRENAERAIVVRIEGTENKLRTWEGRAEGATGLLRYLPHSVAAAVSAVITYIASNRVPPP